MRCRFLVPVLLFSFVAFAQENPGANKLPETPTMAVSAETRAAMQAIIGDTLVNGRAYEYDRELSDTIGARLTGSPQYLEAVKWGQAKFRELGLTNVHTETFVSDTWQPVTAATGRIVSPVNHTLHIWSYGWSPSTPKQGVEGEVVFLPSMAADAIRALATSATGKILLFDRGSYPDPFTLDAYSKAMAAIDALHPQAVLTTGSRYGESQGDLSADGKPSPYPVAQVSLEDELLLKRLLQHGPARVHFSFTNHTATHVTIPQVIAEIKGSERPDEVVIVGGHLDSWHPGTGAQDNGTGIAQVIDAARAIMNLKHPPRRTVRFILFGGEEQGLFGSVAYANQHVAEMGKIDAVLITDLGGGVAKGWHVMGRNDEPAALHEVSNQLGGLGAEGVSKDTHFLFSSDHSAFDVLGVPTLVLWTDMTKYNTLHHKAADTFDSVDKTSLLQGDAVVAATAYAIADSTAPFAPHITPAQVETMLRDAKQWDDYQSMKSADMMP